MTTPPRWNYARSINSCVIRPRLGLVCCEWSMSQGKTIYILTTISWPSGSHRPSSAHFAPLRNSTAAHRWNNQYLSIGRHLRRQPIGKANGIFSNEYIDVRADLALLVDDPVT